jgi:glycosyltransferase involved in cell wall biosynthesis
MEIIIINHYAVPASEPGITRHFSLAKELVARGHRVTIVAANFNHVTKNQIVDDANAGIVRRQYDSVSFIWVPVCSYKGNSPARIANILGFTRIVNKKGFSSYLLPRPDVIIGSSPHPLAAWVAERLAHRLRVPFVMEVRDLWPQTLIDLGRISSQHPAIRFLSWLERYLYNRAERIITLLPGAGEYIAARGINKEKVVWISNGIDMSLVPPSVGGEEKERFTVMYAGSHALANGLDTIIDCANVLHNKGWDDKVVFRFVGDGAEKPILKEKAETLNLHNIVFEDSVSKVKIYGKLQEASAFIAVTKSSPLYKYGISPNKLFDYMAMARPIIFGVDAYNDPVKDAGAGISVPTEDPVALAEAIKQLVNMSVEERQEIGLRGRRYVEKHYDFRKLAEKLEQVLFDAIRVRELGQPVNSKK